MVRRSAAAACVLLLAAPLPAQVQRVVPSSTAQVQASYSPVVKAAAPAVVNIYTAKIVPQGPRSMAELFAMQFQGAAPPPRVEQSLGSGVIVGADGTIVTNEHVVRGADQILVALADRREYPAKVEYSDKRVDLAVLRIDPKGAVLPTVALADSDQVEVGDLVLAIGDPFGFGQTVTHGIVSGLARNGIGVSDRQFFLQTDASINPGNSGGALLDMSGRLIGINTALYSQSGGSVGINFAIPSNMVRVFLAAAPKGRLVTGWIGAEGEGLTSDSARALGLERPVGVLITGVAPGSPAAAAGMRPGDIVTAIDGKPTDDAGALRYRLATSSVGETITVSLRRNGSTLSLPVRLAAPPEVPRRDLTPVTIPGLLNGITLANLSPAYSQELGLGLPERGVVVVAMAAGAPTRQLKLAPGDLIEAVNGATVTTVADAVRAAAGPPVSLRYRRGETITECVVQPDRRFTCRAVK